MKTQSRREKIDEYVEGTLGAWEHEKDEIFFGIEKTPGVLAAEIQANLEKEFTPEEITEILNRLGLGNVTPEKSEPVFNRVLKEFIRRLTAEGYEPDLDELGAGTVRDGEQSVTVMEDGEVRYKPEARDLAHRIRDLRDEVEEYMTAFQNAAPGVERFPRGGKEDTRTLMRYNGHELAVRHCSDDSVDFMTLARVGGRREHRHYYGSYAAAKEDFAMRCGLIDRRKLFTETELKLIRSGLAEIADITPDRGMKEVQAIRALVEKIDDLVIPELAEQEQEAEDQGFEPEIDL